MQHSKSMERANTANSVHDGALSDPVDGAVLLLKGESLEVAEKFARINPYVTSGIVEALACTGVEDGGWRKFTQRPLGQKKLVLSFPF